MENITGNSNEKDTTTTTSTTTAFLDLPEELHLIILSHLEPSDLELGVRWTCLKLHDLSFHPSLWKRLTLEAEPSTLTLQTCSLQGTVRELTECCDGPVNHHSVTQGAVYPNLRGLTLLYCDQPPMGSFLAQHRQLRSLAVKDMQCRTANEFERLASLIENVTLCKGLSELVVIDMGYTSSENSECRSVWGALQNYVQTGPALTQLHLEIPLNDVTVSTILGQCRSLQRLTLARCPLTARAFASTLDTPHDSLTVLDLSDCIIRDSDIIYAIAHSFGCLQELHLQGYARTSTALSWAQAVNVLPTPELFPQLTVLRLWVHNAEQLDSEESPEMPLAVEYPDTVKVPGVWVKRLRLSTGTTSVTGKLRRLLLSTVWNEIKLDRADVVSRQPDLEELSIYQEHAAVAEDFLRVVAMSCRRLRSVTIHCHVSLAGLEHLRTLPWLTKLEFYLLEDQEERGSGEGVALRGADPTKAPGSRLESVKLVPDKAMSMSHLLTLTTLCPWLTNLCIQGPLRGTHQPLRTILKSLRCLRTLYVSGTASSTVPEDGKIFNDEDMDAMLKLGPSSLESIHWSAPVELESLESLARVLVRRPPLDKLECVSVGAPCKTRKSGGGLWGADSYRSVVAKEMREMGACGEGRPRVVQAAFSQSRGMNIATFLNKPSKERKGFHVTLDEIGVTTA